MSWHRCPFLKSLNLPVILYDFENNAALQGQWVLEQKLSFPSPKLHLGLRNLASCSEQADFSYLKHLQACRQFHWVDVLNQVVRKVQHSETFESFDASHL